MSDNYEVYAGNMRKYTFHPAPTLKRAVISQCKAHHGARGEENAILCVAFCTCEPFGLIFLFIYLFLPAWRVQNMRGGKRRCMRVALKTHCAQDRIRAGESFLLMSANEL